MHSRMVYGKKDGKLVKAQLDADDAYLATIVTKHQKWLRNELKSDTPVFGLIIGEPNELLST